MATREPAGEMKETFNMAGLTQKLESGELDDPMLHQYLAAAVRDPNSDFGHKQVEYYKKHGIGRRYAKKPCAQPMKKPWKRAMFTLRLAAAKSSWMWTRTIAT